MGGTILFVWREGWKSHKASYARFCPAMIARNAKRHWDHFEQLFQKPQLQRVWGRTPHVPCFLPSSSEVSPLMGWSMWLVLSSSPAGTGGVQGRNTAGAAAAQPCIYKVFPRAQECRGGLSPGVCCARCWTQRNSDQGGVLVGVGLKILGGFTVAFDYHFKPICLSLSFIK